MVYGSALCPVCESDFNDCECPRYLPKFFENLPVCKSYPELGALRDIGSFVEDVLEHHPLRSDLNDKLEAILIAVYGVESIPQAREVFENFVELMDQISPVGFDFCANAGMWGFWPYPEEDFELHPAESWSEPDPEFVWCEVQPEVLVELCW